MQHERWRPVNEAPRDEEFNWISFPVGTFLRRKSGEIILLGDELAGVRTSGCDCCSSNWEEVLCHYTHFLLPSGSPYPEFQEEA